MPQVVGFAALDDAALRETLGSDMRRIADALQALA